MRPHHPSQPVLHFEIRYSAHIGGHDSPPLRVARDIVADKPHAIVQARKQAQQPLISGVTLWHGDVLIPLH